MFRAFALSLTLILVTLPARAESEAARLASLMRLPAIVELMRKEGLKNGAELFDDSLPLGSRDRWDGEIDALYDTARMEATFLSAFEDALEGQDISDMLVFFDTELGQKIIGLELTAREALLDDDISEIVIEEYYMAERDGDTRLDLIHRYSEANALIEQNVEGAMNSNYAFMTGMNAMSERSNRLPEDQIVNQIWSQEPDIRAEAEEWLFSYLLMAYRPLSDGELETYIAISETEEGQMLNAALFEAFDDMFNQISYSLGETVGRFAQGQDI